MKFGVCSEGVRWERREVGRSEAKTGERRRHVLRGIEVSSSRRLGG